MFLYQAYNAQQAAMEPVRWLANEVRTFANRFANLPSSFSNPMINAFTAACDVVADAKPAHDRPDYGIHAVPVKGRLSAVEEKLVLHKPFCNLLHFKKQAVLHQPRVLVIAPMSGHFSTLLRGTIETLLQEHDVYVTDWINARNVPLSQGPFDLDSFIDYIIEFLRFLESEVTAVAVCQPAVPLVAAVSAMAQMGDSCQPKGMVLMGGPLDARVSPTKVNEFAQSGSIEAIKQMVITYVPPPYPGMMRAVYPGFLQLSGFMSMNIGRHVRAHLDMFHNLVKGDGESVASTKKFYKEYLTVMDMSADFYLQTLKAVFQNYDLPLGKFKYRDMLITPSAIEKTALMTVEGAEDDICGPGQTQAAHVLCSGIPAGRRLDYMQEGVGHYGVFNGRKFREQIAPRIVEFIRGL